MGLKLIGQSLKTSATKCFHYVKLFLFHVVQKTTALYYMDFVSALKKKLLWPFYQAGFWILEIMKRIDQLQYKDFLRLGLDTA